MYGFFAEQLVDEVHEVIRCLEALLTYLVEAGFDDHLAAGVDGADAEAYAEVATEVPGGGVTGGGPLLP